MQDDRHCKACGHLLAMHDKEGCTATFPKPCKCGGFIQNTPFDKSSLHDIRLRTTVNGIWYLLSRSPSLSMNQLDFKVTVHRTDTVSVVIGCSFSPVAVDKAGIIRLSNALTLVHDRLERLIKDSNVNSGLLIPSRMTWTVTMWHFGADASISYKGKSFHVNWKVAENALVALYSKVWKGGKRRIRAERQEYPYKALDEAFDEKLNLRGGVKKIVQS